YLTHSRCKEPFFRLMEDVGRLAQGPERSQAPGAHDFRHLEYLGALEALGAGPAELACERLEGGRRRAGERGKPGCVLVAERVRAVGPRARGEGVAQLAEHVVQV